MIDSHKVIEVLTKLFSARIISTSTSLKARRIDKSSKDNISMNIIVIKQNQKKISGSFIAVFD